MYMFHMEPFFIMLIFLYSTQYTRTSSLFSSIYYLYESNLDMFDTGTRYWSNKKIHKKIDNINSLTENKLF